MVLEGVDEAEGVPPFATDVDELVQGHHVDVGHLGEDLVELAETDVQPGCDLHLAGAAVQLRLQRRVSTLDLTRLAAHRPRYPVDGAELVDDRASDAGDGVGLELDGALEVELVDGVDEAEDPVRDQVCVLNVGRQADTHPAGDVLDQRRVVQDQLLAQVGIAGGLVLHPHLDHSGLGVGDRIGSRTVRLGHVHLNGRYRPLPC